MKARFRGYEINIESLQAVHRTCSFQLTLMYIEQRHARISSYIWSNAGKTRAKFIVDWSAPLDATKCPGEENNSRNEALDLVGYMPSLGVNH